LILINQSHQPEKKNPFASTSTLFFKKIKIPPTSWRDLPFKIPFKFTLKHPSSLKLKKKKTTKIREKKNRDGFYILLVPWELR